MIQCDQVLQQSNLGSQFSIPSLVKTILSITLEVLYQAPNNLDLVKNTDFILLAKLLFITDEIYNSCSSIWMKFTQNLRIRPLESKISVTIEAYFDLHNRCLVLCLDNMYLFNNYSYILPSGIVSRNCSKELNVIFYRIFKLLCID